MGGFPGILTWCSATANSDHLYGLGTHSPQTSEFAPEKLQSDVKKFL